METDTTEENPDLENQNEKQNENELMEKENADENVDPPN
jgi:hypothetical protein